MNEYDCNLIVKNRFSFFNTFEYYRLNGRHDIPDQKGVYVVVMPNDFIVQFRPTTDGPDVYKSRNLVVAIDELEQNWVENSRILYIGMAGGESHKLKDRIWEYVRYGYYKEDKIKGRTGCTNHRGGRYIWQLESNKELLIGYTLWEDARILESVLIKQFEVKYKKKPFANLQR